VLLDWQGTAYADTAEDVGLDVGGWSWDTKVEDFDLDGDLDVYIVNGTWVPNEVSPSNLYFENDGTGRFTEASGPMGLEDYLMTAAATAFDADGDGDLDIVTHPVNGPLVMFRNNSQARALAFELTDLRGNRDAIGALVMLEDATGRTQSREIQMGGGFMSFDAPRATFGLGDLVEATEARIRWPDGAETVIDGPLPAGQLYRVTRRGGVVVWVVGDATKNGSETGSSFKQALYAMDCGFNLHDTMIYEKAQACFGSNNCYLQSFEYMFVLSKGKPRSINFIRDRENVRGGVSESTVSHGTKSDGSRGPRVTKTAARFGKRKNIWKYGVGGGNTGHPAVFPLALAEDHVKTWSDPGDTVLDPFMGSGTTGAAAIKNGRHFVGIEVSDEYASAAAIRIKACSPNA